MHKAHIGGLPSQLISRRARSALLAAFVALSTGSGLWAANINWGGSNISGDWSDASKWTGGVEPGASDDATFSGSTSSVAVTAANEVYQNLYASNTSLSINGGALATTFGFGTYLGYVANSTTTAFIISGSWDSARTEVGSGSGSSATVNMFGGQWRFNSSPLIVAAGANASGTVNISGGTISGVNNLYVGLGSGGTGVMTMTGSTPSVSSGTVNVGWGGTGTLSVWSGTLATGTLSVGNGSGVAVLNLEAGAVTMSSLSVADNGASTGTVNIGRGGNYTGTLTPGSTITGGTGTGGARLNFNHTGAVSFGNVIAGSMIVTKLASGVTTLTGANTYTGGTLVSVGTLLANSSNSTGSGVVTVASGAKLGGSGTIGGSVVASGKVAAGDILSGVAQAGQLAVTGNVTWNGTAGNAWEFQLNGGSFDKLVITGNLIKGTGTTFQFDLTGATAGTYQLATFNSSTFVASDFTTTGLAGGYSALYSKTAGALSVNVSAVPEPSTVAMIAGSVILGYVVIRRRKTAATAEFE